MWGPGGGQGVMLHFVCSTVCMRVCVCVGREDGPFSACITVCVRVWGAPNSDSVCACAGWVGGGGHTSLCTSVCTPCLRRACVRACLPARFWRISCATSPMLWPVSPTLWPVSPTLWPYPPRSGPYPPRSGPPACLPARWWRVSCAASPTLWHAGTSASCGLLCTYLRWGHHRHTPLVGPCAVPQVGPSQAHFSGGAMCHTSMCRTSGGAMCRSSGGAMSFPGCAPCHA